MTDFEGCPPCKIILDGGVVGLAAALYSDTVNLIQSTFTRSIGEGHFTPEQVDQAHALSELWCHRAALFRDWAEEDRLYATAMIGGEYHGGFDVNGVDSISKKP